MNLQQQDMKLLLNNMKVKKNIILLISVLLLTGCNKDIIESEIVASNESILESNLNVVDSENTSNNMESINVKDNIIDIEKIEIAVNKKFNLRNHLIDSYANAFFIEMVEVQNDIIIDINNESALLSFDANDNIIGKKVGNSLVRVFLDGNDTNYHDIEVIVLDIKDYYLRCLDEKTLIGKSATIFGDSISDNSVSNYENKPTFWVEMLKSNLKMTNVYNYAESGSTLGYSVSREKNYHYDFYGTYKVQKAQNDLKKSDYVFIFFGANDFCVKENIGNKDDINDTNYKNTESFKGAYYYLIQKIYEANPNIEIVCLSCSYSSWGFVDNYDEATNYATSRNEMNKIIQEIALDNNATFINVYDLWDQNNMNIYAPDGIHPLTEGYTKIIERLIGKI